MRRDINDERSAANQKGGSETEKRIGQNIPIFHIINGVYKTE
jgi:hypothetical protein